MKGVLESIPEFFQVVIALAVAIIIIIMATQLADILKKPPSQIVGTKYQVAQGLSKLIADCWSSHRNGLDAESAVCNVVNVSSKEVVTKEDVVSLINKKILPEDKLAWSVSSNETSVKITYSGSERIIEVKEI